MRLECALLDCTASRTPLIPRHMPKRPKTTSGRLLQRLDSVDEHLRDSVLVAAGLSVETAASVMLGDRRLSTTDQLRLADVVAEQVPELKRDALRLRDQAIAARHFENQDYVDRHLSPPKLRWETSGRLSR